MAPVINTKFFCHSDKQGSNLRNRNHYFSKKLLLVAKEQECPENQKIQGTGNPALMFAEKLR